MEKKQYTTPLLEVTDLGTLGRLMKELGEASLPGQVGGAPSRKVPVLGNDTVRAF